MKFPTYYPLTRKFNGGSNKRAWISRAGSVEVLLPISIVKAVGDLISVDKTVMELRDIVEPTKK
jgi:hypothetical protein